MSYAISMMLRSLLLLLVLTFSAAAQAEPREILWDQLIPEGWDPYALFDQFTDEEYAALSDEDYLALQDRAQEMMTKAPVNEALDGEAVRIPGFVLPLEFDGMMVSEFLLVPYFGACIHTPPPPANQIIRGSLAESWELEEITRPVWISGKLKTGRVTSKLGEAGYTMTLDVHSGYSMEVNSIEPYTQSQ